MTASGLRPGKEEGAMVSLFALILLNEPSRCPLFTNLKFEILIANDED